jgi:hypothetical protein
MIDKWVWKVEGLKGTWMITTPDEGVSLVMSGGAVQCLAAWLVRLCMATALHRMSETFEVELQASDFLAVYYDGRVASQEGVVYAGSE